MSLAQSNSARRLRLFGAKRTCEGGRPSPAITAEGQPSRAASCRSRRDELTALAPVHPRRPSDAGLEAHDDRPGDATLVDLFVVSEVLTGEPIADCVAVAARAVKYLEGCAACRRTTQTARGDVIDTE